MSERTAAYRMFDASEELLYVGVAKSFGTRWTSHARVQSWWGDVQRQTVDWYPSREEALLEEKRAIHAEAPVHNIAGSPWEKRVKDDGTGFYVVPKVKRAEDTSNYTPRRSIRIPDDEWEAAKAAADESGETLSDVIRVALRRYVARRAKRAGSGS